MSIIDSIKNLVTKKKEVPLGSPFYKPGETGGGYTSTTDPRIPATYGAKNTSDIKNSGSDIVKSKNVNTVSGGGGAISRRTTQTPTTSTTLTTDTIRTNPTQASLRPDDLTIDITRSGQVRQGRTTYYGNAMVGDTGKTANQFQKELREEYKKETGKSIGQGRLSGKIETIETNPLMNNDTEKQENLYFKGENVKQNAVEYTGKEGMISADKSSNALKGEEFRKKQEFKVFNYGTTSTDKPDIETKTGKQLREEAIFFGENRPNLFIQDKPTTTTEKIIEYTPIISQVKPTLSAARKLSSEYSTYVGAEAMLGSQASQKGFRSAALNVGVQGALLASDVYFAGSLARSGLKAGQQFVEKNIARQVSMDAEQLAKSRLKGVQIVKDGEFILKAKQTAGNLKRDIDITGKAIKGDKGIYYIQEAEGKATTTGKYKLKFDDSTFGKAKEKVLNKFVKERVFVSPQTFDISTSQVSKNIGQFKKLKVSRSIGVGTFTEQSSSQGLVKNTKKGAEELKNQLRNNFLNKEEVSSSEFLGTSFSREAKKKQFSLQFSKDSQIFGISKGEAKSELPKALTIKEPDFKILGGENLLGEKEVAKQVSKQETKQMSNLVQVEESVQKGLGSPYKAEPFKYSQKQIVKEELSPFTSKLNFKKIEVKAIETKPTILNVQTTQSQIQKVGNELKQERKSFFKNIKTSNKSRKNQGIVNQIVETAQKQTQFQSQDTKQLFKQLQKQKQKKAQDQKNIQETINIITTKSIITNPNIIKPKFTPKPSSSFNIASIAKKTESGDFNIFVTKKGKIGSAKTSQGATDLLESYLGKTLKASGYLEKGGKKVSTSELNLGMNFRKGKSNNFLVVEKKEKRLRKGGTGKSIQYFR